MEVLFVHDLAPLAREIRLSPGAQGCPCRRESPKGREHDRGLRLASRPGTDRQASRAPARAWRNSLRVMRITLNGLTRPPVNSITAWIGSGDFPCCWDQRTNADQRQTAWYRRGLLRLAARPIGRLPPRAPAPVTPAQRRGPVGPMPDAALLGAIRAVLAASPFHGEGLRKVWARLRHGGTRTSLRRVLRLCGSTICSLVAGRRATRAAQP